MESGGSDNKYNIVSKSENEDASDLDSLNNLLENMIDDNISGLKKITWSIYRDSNTPNWEVGMIPCHHIYAINELIKTFFIVFVLRIL